MTNDVRKALAVLIEKARADWSRLADNPEYGADAPDAIADAILAAFEVRPHGTVTDAEVEAAALCLGERFGHSGEHYVEEARAALEAAWGA